MASRGLRSLLALAGWIALPVIVGALGSVFGPGPWYEALAKPAWNPPNEVFAPVWTTLYVLMGVAAWRVWRLGGWPTHAGALGLFLAQLVALGIWPVLFFGLENLWLALADQVLIVLLVFLVMRRFSRIDRAAGWLLAPTLAWVLFATALTVALIALN